MGGCPERHAGSPGTRLREVSKPPLPLQVRTKLARLGNHACGTSTSRLPTLPRGQQPAGTDLAPGQAQALARAFGCARVVYNDCLRLRDACHAAGEKISDTEVQRQAITLAKRTPEREWLGEVASVALVQACQDARRAYRNWFDSLKGRRKGPKIRHPKPRRKRSRRN